ncbi:hypothetical protein [Sphaerimonospora thailandensis]|uniref:Uncharacterized protein n=1 Tax=Sphaerimonospora thailandensis TaxID=795644 RepID=A0A8J3R958_9ACTN|nr:hypothetical protein [Sphaerimonospora thailandensis]GIH71422.1 hypothetical protein Mth01_36750 [Sphaerimonospora thailandensis]
MSILEIPVNTLDGEVVARFRPRVEPEAPEIVEAVEKVIAT